MSLNLGNLTNDASNISFEDAYIAWLEADQKFIDLMNATEIVEKAKASQSVECIHFAEELLGCSLEEFEASMEVQLHPGRGAHGWNEHIERVNDEASTALRNTVSALHRRLYNVRQKLAGIKTEVTVPGIVRSFSEIHATRHHNTVSNKRPWRTSTKVSPSQAAEICREALEWVLKVANVDPVVFDEKDSHATTEWGKYGKGYLSQRKKIAAVLKGIKTTISALERVARIGK